MPISYLLINKLKVGEYDLIFLFYKDPPDRPSHGQRQDCIRIHFIENDAFIKP